MKLGRPAKRNASALVWIVVGCLVLFFLIAFRKEILWLAGFSPNSASSQTVLDPPTFLFYVVLLGYFLVFSFWMVLISFQAILPALNIGEDFFGSLLEVHRTIWHFFLYLLHLHGPAVSVKDGAANTTSEDLKREDLPGVVIVDYNSAVVLEERNPPPGLVRLLLLIIMAVLRALMLVDPYQSPRVRGAGITFTRPRERIRGVVDLRKQFRMATRVPCYTCEGIELKANIFSLFTIGQDADILEVAFVGAHRAENLHIVSFEHSTGVTGLQNLRVSAIADDLDAADRAEIFHFANQVRRGRQMLAYTSLPDTNVQRCDAGRVFSAIFGEARDDKHELFPWTELPARVGADMYREILGQVRFDDLYDLRKEGKLPLMHYRTAMRRKMRFNGILAFRLIETANGAPFVVGRHYAPRELVVSEARELTNPKVLRDRGIKVIFSSFGDPTPVNEAVYLHRLDSWRSTWDRALNEAQGSFEYDAMRVRAKEYVDTQQKIMAEFALAFEQHDISDEALAVSLLQALEKATTDPKTRALLPPNTIDMMREIHMLLIPGDYMMPPVGPNPPKP